MSHTRRQEWVRGRSWEALDVLGVWCQVKNEGLGWGCSSGVKRLLSMHEALSSTTAQGGGGGGKEGRKKGKKRKKRANLALVPNASSNTPPPPGLTLVLPWYNILQDLV